MGFAERAVAALKESLSRGVVSERQTRDVLRCDINGVDFACYLLSDEVMVRRVAARIIAGKGPVDKLVEAALVEKDRSLLVDMLGMLSRCQWRDKMLELEFLLASDDVVIRDAAIDMFKKLGRLDSLSALLFSEDEYLVSRIKRYLDEKREGREVSRS
jgi:hypothetical protein